MARRQRTNTNALSYLGVSADAPADVVIEDRDPTQNDIDFDISTMWLRTQSTKRVFMLLGKANKVATWAQVYPAGGAGAQNFITDSGTATVNAGDITFTGGVGLQTEASGASTVTIEPNQPNQGFVFMSAVGFQPVTSPDGSIDITFTAGGLELEVDATIASAVTSVDTDSGTAIPNNNTLEIVGGRNINTLGAGNTITVRTNENIDLPDTASSTVGTYRIDGATILHTFGLDNTNTFLGEDSGNFTMDPVFCTNNVGLGRRTLRSLTDGSINVAAGFQALRDITTGDENVAIGSGAGLQYTSSESNNVLICNGGVVGENDTIRIGNSRHTRAFFEGIYKVNPPGTSAQYVIIDNNNQLGSTDYTGSGGVEATRVNIVTHLPSDLQVVVSNNNLPPSQGGNAVVLGEDLALVEDRDDSNDFFPGDGMGSPAEFTVPRDGDYFFQIDVYNVSEPLVDTSYGTTRYKLSNAELAAYQTNPFDRIVGAGRKTFVPDAESPDAIERRGYVVGPKSRAGIRLQAGAVIRFSSIVGSAIKAGATPLIGGGSDFTFGRVTSIGIRELWSTGF